ncbi:MAG: serine/threonine-protein kinase [Gemmataceae bacterium]
MPSSDWFDSLRADQSEAWHRGECPRVEEFLQRDPRLADHPDRLVDLIVSELMLRLNRNERASLDEYLQRFPDLESPLRARWDLLGMIMPHTGSGRLTAPDAPTQDASPPPPSLMLPEIPGYQILHELGRGGMGIVYQAWQIPLCRSVAIKFIRGGPLAGEEEVARFFEEARALASLSHPGLVRIHDFGDREGVQYLVLECLTGGTLTERLKQGRLPIAEAACLVRDLARALQAAHEAGIIHRDLKPGNILFDDKGQPRVCDFGLARSLESAPGLTEPDTVMGTPAYMSPEQAQARHHDICRATDVWALGVILYECLTGKQPFLAESRTRTLDRVCHADPVPPHQLCPEIPASLELICLHCLEKSASQRYPSAADLADELDRYLHDQPVLVRQPGLGRRLLARVRPWWRVGAALLLIALASLLLWQFVLSPATSTPMDVAARSLRQGETLPLLNPLGGPLGPRLMQGTGVLSPHPQEEFLVETWAIAVVELLPHMPITRFRMRGQMSRKDGRGTSMGLTLGLNPNPGKGQAGYLAWVIHEGDRSQPDAKTDAELRWEPGEGAGPAKSLWRGRLPRSSPGWWHSMQVEVDTDELRLYAEKVLLAKVSSHTLDVPFNPQGGLGLITRVGSVQFREIEVEPLDP